MKLTLSFIAVLAVCFTACNSNKVFNERVAIDQNSGWNKDSLITIQYNISDISIPYNLKIDLRVLEFYPSANLWLFVKTISPDNLVAIDTLNCSLFDDKGVSTGDAIGGIYDYLIDYKQNIKFKKAGTYTMKFQHGMRIDNLPCVGEIGVFIEKTPLSN